MIYQQHSLKGFQRYFKKGTNERGKKGAGQKNAEFIFEKLHLIHNFKFHIFNSMTIILYLSFHMLSYFWVIHNL